MWRCGPENETRELDWREPTEAKKLVGKETYKSCRSKLSVGVARAAPPLCPRDRPAKMARRARAARPRQGALVHAAPGHRLAVTGASVGLAAGAAAAAMPTTAAAAGSSSSTQALVESSTALGESSTSSAALLHVDSQTHVHQLISLLQVCARNNCLERPCCLGRRKKSRAPTDTIPSRSLHSLNAKLASNRRPRSRTSPVAWWRLRQPYFTSGAPRLRSSRASKRSRSQ